MVDKVKTATTTNSTATSHINQFFLVNRVIAVTKLRIPTRAKCGAKLVKGNSVRSIIPVIV